MVGSEDARAAVKRFWDEHGDEWDRTIGQGTHTAADRNRWISVFDDLPAARLILEVGAGAGFASLLLTDLNHYVTAYDWSENRLAAARRNADYAGMDLTFQVGEADDLPFGEKAFHTVVARHVLWTLLDPLAAFREWRRVVRPTGRVIADITLDEPGDPLTDEIAHLLPLHKLSDPAPVIAMFNEAGFSSVDAERWPPDARGAVTVILQARP